MIQKKSSFTIKQISEMFSVTENTVRNWGKEGKITPKRVRKGKREDRVFDEKDIKEIISKGLAKLVNVDSEKMSLEELESFLWSSADILRNRVNAASYSKYIFGLLFYKRISDVWKEEYDETFKKYGDVALANDPVYHKIQLPKNVNWSTVVDSPPNKMGERINENLKRITKENKPSLDRIFDKLDFAEKEIFSDEVLQELVNHFSKQNFGNDNYPSDMLGDAFEFIIKKFADDGGATAGQHYSPRGVERMIIQILNPDEKDKIYDPSVGSGGFLLEANNYLKDKYDDGEIKAYLYGQELNLETYSIAKINMFLHNIEYADIRQGDTLSDPKFKDKEEFEVVVSNFPYSVKQWSVEKFKSKHGSEYETPPKGNADYAFIIHIIQSLSKNGKAGIVVPHGVLLRSNTEKRIREKIIKEDLIEAVIGMPPNLFYGTSIPVAILILNKNKVAERKNKILFINASDLYKPERNKNVFEEKHIKEVLNIFTKYKKKEKFCSVKSVKDIEKNDYSLNINLYVNSSKKEEEIDIKATLKEESGIDKELKKVEKDMKENLKILGFNK